MFRSHRACQSRAVTGSIHGSLASGFGRDRAAPFLDTTAATDAKAAVEHSLKNVRLAIIQGFAGEDWPLAAEGGRAVPSDSMRRITLLSSAAKRPFGSART
jgi:hypothetical protein